VDLTGRRHGQALPGSRDQQRRVDCLAAIDGSRAADDAITQETDIRSKSEPRFHSHAKVCFKSAFGEIPGWADHVVEAREEGESVDVLLLSRTGQAEQESKGAKQDALHIAHSVR